MELKEYQREISLLMDKVLEAEGKEKTEVVEQWGMEKGLIVPCYRCQSILVINWEKVRDIFRGPTTDNARSFLGVASTAGVDIQGNSVHWITHGDYDTSYVHICSDCDLFFQDMENDKEKEDYETWPIFGPPIP